MRRAFGPLETTNYPKRAHSNTRAAIRSDRYLPDVRWERVHTVTAYYDGPTAGIADFDGCPHAFERAFDEIAQDWTHYRLTPISAETLALALEDWAIWKRWEAAFYAGRATYETHPALPEDRTRHDALA